MRRGTLNFLMLVTLGGFIFSALSDVSLMTKILVCAAYIGVRIYYFLGENKHEES